MILIQFQKLHVNTEVTNHHDNTKNKSEIENYEFRIGELEMQKEELLSEINVKYIYICSLN